MDLREVGYDDRDWINLAQDRDQWREPPGSLKASKSFFLLFLFQNTDFSFFLPFSLPFSHILTQYRFPRRFAGKIASLCYVTKDTVRELINGHEMSKSHRRSSENGIICEQHQGSPYYLLLHYTNPFCGDNTQKSMSRGSKVAAPPLDLSCATPVTWPGDIYITDNHQVKK
ncbi:hypothetical protein ANN_06933 [Periplaneta americana]|uniref:Uncharacterized protein n=1 Tax=Periplaneta americana TaxID=6978 RepID=A0ABQ8TGT8_PERAM|nr:hypothetical protein ANN_06933 [Periplaneta americana]